jgi:rod shape-determining protein MreD
VSFFRGILALAGGLLLEAGLGRWFPASRDYVDVLMVPVAWYGIVRSQRAAMFMGCAAGLLQDGWFQVGVFGSQGFRKTLLGWVLGGLGSRFDLNQGAGRFLSGALLTVADRLLEVALLKLLDQTARPPAPLAMTIRAVVTGLLVVLVFAILDRVRGKDVVSRRST